MHVIHRGPATACFEIGNDRVLRVRWTGLVLPANAGAISAALLHAAAGAGVIGIVGTLVDAALALPPVTAGYYDHVPEALRGLPVAIVTSTGQESLYAEVAQEAALSGTLRRAFVSFDDGESWLQAQARACAANRHWWSMLRSEQ